MQQQLLIADAWSRRGGGAAVYNAAVVRNRRVRKPPWRRSLGSHGGGNAFRAGAYGSQGSRALLRNRRPYRHEARAYAELESRKHGKLWPRLNDEMPRSPMCSASSPGCAASPRGLRREYLPGHTSIIRRDPVAVVARLRRELSLMIAWKIARDRRRNTLVLKPSS